MSRTAASFDRDALGEVARLIHVASEPHRDVISEQLQRHDLEQRQQQFVRRRNRDDVVGALAHLVFIAPRRRRR